MIFNRTEKDVKDAILIRDEKIKNFLSLSQEEIDIIEKGFLTKNTIERIENAQKELESVFHEMGYHGFNISTKNIEEYEFFYMDDLERIVNNNISLRNAFLSTSKMPKNASAKYDYINLNLLEKLLFDLENLASFIRQNYSECGNVECGGGKL